MGLFDDRRSRARRRADYKNQLREQTAEKSGSEPVKAAPTAAPKAVPAVKTEPTPKPTPLPKTKPAPKPTPLPKTEPAPKPVPLPKTEPAPKPVPVKTAPQPSARPPKGGSPLVKKLTAVLLTLLILTGAVIGYVKWYDIVQLAEDWKKEDITLLTLASADYTFAAERYQYIPLSYEASAAPDTTLTGYGGSLMAQFVPGVDFLLNDDTTLEEAKVEIDALIAFASGLSVYTVLIPMQTEAGALFAADGFDTLFDGQLAAYMVTALRKAGLSPVLVVSPFDWQRGGQAVRLNPADPEDRVTLLNLMRALTRLSPAGVSLSDVGFADGEADYADYAAAGIDCGFEVYKRRALSDCLYAVSEIFRSADSGCSVGLCVNPVWKLLSSDSSGLDVNADREDYYDRYADTKNLLYSGIFDFVQLLDLTSLSDDDLPFENVFDWWAQAASGAGVSLYVTHAADKAATSGGWKSYDQLPKQIVAVQDTEGYSGSILYSLSRLQLYSEICSVIKQAVAGEVDGDDILRTLTITAPKKTSTKTYEKMLTLSGSSDPNFSVQINGETIERTSKGYFSLNFELEIGVNEFVITHKGTTKTYKVEREVLLFKSVDPSQTYTIYAGSPIIFSAVALKGSTLYAKVDGQKVEMTEDAILLDEESESGSDYINYTGVYNVPESSKTRTISDIKIYGDWEGYTDSKSCADIKVKEIDKSTVRVATVIADNAEVFRDYTVDDKSVPTSYPLPKGTRDYIKGEVTYAFTEDGSKNVYVYYVLQSGKRVYKSKNGTAVNDVSVEYGVSVASNSISQVSVAVSGGYTSLYFDMASKVPFSLELGPQTYTDAYSLSPDFTVSSCTATEVTLTFHYTTDAAALPTLSGSAVFSGISGWSRSGTDMSLTLKLAQTGEFHGVYAEYAGDTLVLSFCEPAVLSKTTSGGYSLSGITIMLDPGHGGHSTGAVGANPNYPEKRLNLELSLKIKSMLESYGATVLMTRSSDVYLTLDERVALCEKYRPDLFISVHHNYAASVSAHGTDSFYFMPFSKGIANSIYERLISFYGSTMYPGSSSTAYQRGCNYFPFAVTRHWYCPSTLVEYGFMSNSAELQKLIDSNNQTGLARATVNGILDYFKSFGVIGSTVVSDGGSTGDGDSQATSSVSPLAGVETEEGYYDSEGVFHYWAPGESPFESSATTSVTTSETTSETASEAVSAVSSAASSPSETTSSAASGG